MLYQFLRPQVAARTTRAAALAATALVLPLAAHAADASDQPSASTIQEVVVTARRVAENIQNVPVAVTAITAEKLQQAAIRNAYDIQNLAPALNITATPYGTDQLQYTIRGQSGNTSTVAIYFNDIYAVDPNATAVPYYDMSNVQVLEGPQGTLFGATATGGAILYSFQQPTHELSAYLSGSAGNLSFGNFNGAVNVPLAQGVDLRVSGILERRAGYTHLTSGGTADGENVYGYRLQLKLEPTSNLHSLFYYDYYKWDQEGVSAILLNVAPCGSVSATGGPIAVACPGFFPTLPAILAQQQALGPRLANLNPANVQTNVEDQRLFENSTSLDLGNHLTLKNMVGYRAVNREIELSDGTPFTVIAGVAYGPVTFGGRTLNGLSEAGSTRTWSDEFQVQGKDYLDGNVNFILGYYHANEAMVPYPGGYLASFGQFLGAAGAGGGAISFSQQLGNNIINAVYGHVDVKLTPISDNLTLTGGYRQNYFDQVNQRSLSLQYVPAFPALSSCRLGSVTNLCTANIANYSEQGDAWDVGLNWKPKSNVLIYISEKHGYKAGMRQNIAALPANLELVKPEGVQDTEIGVKSDFRIMGAPARVDGDVYYQDYTEIQRQGPTRCVANGSFVPCSTPGSTAAAFELNAAKARIYGGEIKFDLRPIEGLSLSAFYSYTNARFTAFNALFTGENLTGLKFANVPDHNFAINARYEFETSFGRPYASVNYDWRSSTYLDDPNSPDGLVPAYGILNFSLGVNNIGGRPMDVFFWANNATNQTRLVSFVGVANSAGIDYGRYLQPATYGVTATLHFGGGANW